MKKLLTINSFKSSFDLLPKIPMRMRITSVLLAGFLFQANAETSYSQSARISIEMNNVTVEEVLNEIESKSEFYFLYNNKLINVDRRVSVDVDAENIESVLQTLFKGTDVVYRIADKQIVLSQKDMIQNTEVDGIQQSKVIIGTIVDASGTPIIGANIMVKGTTNGTISDMDGKFSLEVDKDATLVVSYIGFANQEIRVGNQNNLSITLKEDAEALDEVIVIGYGTTKRKDFTGSVSSVKLENSPIALSPNLNALESLKGNVSGLDIGATNSAGGQPSMQMRGQKSISGSNDPLIVVDGMIFMGSINDINPNDIASFDVLKDATSAAAYGSRSANGVIIITTKKGKTGKPTITLNATGSMQTWQNRPELMNGEQWLESVMARNNSTDLTWLKPQEVANMEAGRETNWLDASTRTGWVQDYQVSVSGASEKMNYYLSAAYSDNQGVIVGDDYNRITALAKINTDITSWLQIGVDAAYTKSDYSGVGADLQQASNMSPYGVMYRDEEQKLLEKYPYTQSGINPLWSTDKNIRDNKDIRNNFRANAYAVVKLPWVEGLSYRFNYAGNLSKNQSGNFYYEGYYVKEGAYDDESRYSPSTLQTLLTNANGSINNNTTSSWVIDNILNYKNTFGKHTIDLTAVATRDRKKYEEIVTTGSDFSANGNTILGMTGLHKAAVQKVNMNYNQRSNIGYLGRASYSFDERYFFTGSYRRDGASVFGANQKWGDFFAFGAAWRMTSEKFMEPISSVLNDLKLKLSWGKKW